MNDKIPNSRAKFKMARVLKYSTKKGEGVILDQTDGNKYKVHFSDIISFKNRNLSEGQWVEYKNCPGENKLQGNENIQLPRAIEIIPLGNSFS